MRTFACLLGVAVLPLSLTTACRLEHPPTPTAIADSSAIARALSLASVPSLDANAPSTLHVSASRIGGSFASAFEREMAPMISFASRASTSGPVATYRVDVEQLQIDEDSAVAVVSESSPEGTNRVRMMLLPRAEGGWRVVSKRLMPVLEANVVLPAESRSGARTPD